MKKKLSYRDKLIELAYIYNVKEIQDYTKRRKHLTTGQIELILKKNKIIIPKDFKTNFFKEYFTKPISRLKSNIVGYKEEKIKDKNRFIRRVENYKHDTSRKLNHGLHNLWKGIGIAGINFLNTSIAANSQFARCIISSSTSTASSFSVNEGVYFIRGFFVKTIASTVILDQYSNSPSYRVGFLIKEEKTSASSVNSDLYDNALGFSNEAAPGADRLKISTTLHKKSLDDIDDKDFVELLRVENGIVREMVTKTEYNIFARELARRTYDESGDYYIRPFSLDVRESLNDRVGNRGIYFDTQQTQNGNTPSDDIISLQVSSGKAYIRGYEVDKISSSSIDVLKPRTTKLEENVSVPVRIGKSMEITNILGSPPVGFTATPIKLLDRRLDADKSAHNSATIIGNARVYDYSQKSITGIGVTTFDLKFYDFQLYTVLELASTITHGVDAHIKGKFSGAVGYAALGAKTNVSEVTLRDVTGEFQINEPLIVNDLRKGII